MNLTLLYVALGGAIGAILRYLTGVGTRHLFGPDLPWGTFVVNIVGSFVMGVVVVVLAHVGGMRWAPFLMVGLLGGFTTFSAFSLDAIVLYERGDVALAAGYVLASVTLAIAALFGGMIAARAWVA